MTCKNTHPVLLVEDDQVDVMTVKRAFNELRIVKPVDYRKFIEAVKTIHLEWKLSEIPE